MDSLHHPISTVEIPSDEDDMDDCTPAPLANNRTLPISGRNSNITAPSPPLHPQVLILVDDDPTPRKTSPPPSRPGRSPAFVPETPISSGPVALGLDSSIVRCSFARSHHPTNEVPESGGLICLESDEESKEGCATKVTKDGDGFGGNGVFWNDGSRGRSSKDGGIVSNDEVGTGMEAEDDDSGLLPDKEMDREESGKYGRCSDEDGSLQECTNSDHHHAMREQQYNATKKRGRQRKVDNGKGTCMVEDIARKKQTKEEKARLMEERKRKRQEERLQKESLKAEAAELKKLQKEKEKWEKGKLALKSIVAEIDNKVVESGTIGGHLLGRFAEKGFSFRITKNPMERSILWKMSIPDQISQLSSMRSEVPYVLFVYEAEEFCNMVLNESLLDHVVSVQKKFPSFTICYLTNKLMSYINRREQNQYKNPSNANCWKRPPVEEVLSKLTTHFSRVRSRQCMDEADLSEHIVGLTSSLASCQFRTKLTWLSVNANGSLVPQGFIDKHLIKKSAWLKALTAIPKVQPRYAIAIWKKFPTMRSLLNIYLDPCKTVHEKEFLLKDLPVEGALGKEDKRLGEACSKRVYRILMAQNGASITDDVENGADFFAS